MIIPEDIFKISHDFAKCFQISTQVFNPREMYKQVKSMFPLNTNLTFNPLVFRKKPSFPGLSGIKHRIVFLTRWHMHPEVTPCCCTTSSLKLLRAHRLTDRKRLMIHEEREDLWSPVNGALFKKGLKKQLLPNQSREIFGGIKNCNTAVWLFLSVVMCVLLSWGCRLTSGHGVSQETVDDRPCCWLCTHPCPYCPGKCSSLSTHICISVNVFILSRHSCPPSSPLVEKRP